MNFNRVQFGGRLTRDPKLKFLPSNLALAEFGMVCNRRYRGANGQDRDEATFVECVAFDRQAEVIARYCKKGGDLFVEGRLKFEQWEDKQSKATRTKLVIVIENTQLIGGNRGEDSPAAPASQPAPRPAPRAATEPDEGNCPF